MVQNLYSERELSIKLLLGEKTKKKTNISPFPATHTYIKLTFVSFFFLFFFLNLSLIQLISRDLNPRSKSVIKEIDKSRYWMGNTGDGARFTVIDTPGFGDRLIEEEKTIESLVQV